MSGEVTINGVRNAVFEVLDTAFPSIPISGEEINLTLEPPRFFVKLLEPEHVQELGRRYRRKHPFAIRYFGVGQETNDMYDMAEQLTAALKWIMIGGRQWPGQEMKFEIVEEVLHFFVTYSLLVWEQPSNVSKMQTLEQEGNIVET